MTELSHTSFTPWPERSTADPRRATQAQYMHGMKEILSYEGPMQALPLFQTYAKAAGLLKITALVRKRFEHALMKGVKAGEVLLEREADSELKSEDDSVGWILRLPEQPEVTVRDLGRRSFAEIPMSELAALVLEIRTQDEFIGRDGIYRATLDHYGLQKLTALVRRRLDKVLEVYF
ncbi:MAG: hypothetical protein ABJ275_08155 [Maricaulaceae bacterium]